MNLADEDYVGKFDDRFVQSVSTENGLYGVPMGQSMAGAVIYNKDIYEQLGLEVPTTWDEFIANSEAIKQAGVAAPIVQTYGDTWTSQLFVLGDFNNVLAENPDWAEEYTNNKAKYVDEPALAGFEHLQEAYDKGLFNEDFASATYADGVTMVATGEGAQYPILTFAAGQLMTTNPEAADVVGTFPLPGPDASTNGLTVWMPTNTVYIPKSTEGDKLEASKKFLEFLATPEACDIQSEANAPQGPFVIEGCDLPDDVPAMGVGTRGDPPRGGARPAAARRRLVAIRGAARPRRPRVGVCRGARAERRHRRDRRRVDGDRAGARGHRPRARGAHGARSRDRGMGAAAFGGRRRGSRRCRGIRGMMQTFHS